MTSGPMPPRDPALLALLQKVGRVRGVACTAYKESCLRRRLAVRMRARGVGSFEEYAALLDVDPHEYQRFLDTLTINVTAFYRNPETWDALARRALPELWQRTGGALRAWSAGCSTGEEAYTLAILLLELAGPAGLRLADGTIDATDLDQDALARGGAGTYPAQALADLPPELAARYLSRGEPRSVVPAVRRLVRFRVHDLTWEPPPQPSFDLVICRNVIIYFDRPLQQRLLDMFAAALPVGGVLVLGKVESLVGPARSAFRLQDVRERVYRRV